jgi:hypothetical protein
MSNYDSIDDYRTDRYATMAQMREERYAAYDPDGDAAKMALILMGVVIAAIITGLAVFVF